MPGFYGEKAFVRVEKVEERLLGKMVGACAFPSRLAILYFIDLSGKGLPTAVISSLLPEGRV
jgi:hypothetical protein